MIRFPEMRAESLGAIRALANGAYQEKVWIGKEYPSRDFYDDFTMNVHILFDDTGVLSDPRAVVGEVVYENEVEGLQRLASVLSPLIDDLGDEPDSVYLADPRWATVVQLAADVERTMVANGPVT